ncbi:asr5054 [Nostoc sp. PCC 7120 = FACHB-418]|nr:asr5054 [Nostoc sp. PCC 7120 = FACHB-418]
MEWFYISLPLTTDHSPLTKLYPLVGGVFIHQLLQKSYFRMTFEVPTEKVQHLNLQSYLSGFWKLYICQYRP